MSVPGEDAGSIAGFVPKMLPVVATEGKAAPMGLRERKKARMRKKIMDTTVNLCRKRGYENTTLEEVVRIVEVSQPTFYNYFASKDAVLREFARELLRPIEGAEVGGGESGLSASDKLRRHYAGVAEWMEMDRPVWRAIILANTFSGGGAEGKEASEAMHSPLDDVMREGQESGEFTPDFSAESLRLHLEAIQGLTCLQWGEGAEAGFSLQERLAEGLEFFLRGARA